MFGQRIKELREARHWSQAELSRRTGIKSGQLSQIESGLRNNPTLETLEIFAAAFDMSLAEFVIALTAEPIEAKAA
jgi:XRE family transcriptional regulator of biofilm formation